MTDWNFVKLYLKIIKCEPYNYKNKFLLNVPDCLSNTAMNNVANILMLIFWQRGPF